MSLPVIYLDAGLLGGILIAAILAGGLLGWHDQRRSRPKVSLISSPDGKDRQCAALDKAMEGRRLLGAGKYQEAITACTEAIELEPSFRGPYQTRARAYGHLGMEKDAEADLIRLEDRIEGRTYFQVAGIVTGRREDIPAVNNPSIDEYFLDEPTYYLTVSLTEFEVSRGYYYGYGSNIGDEIVLTLEFPGPNVEIAGVEGIIPGKVTKIRLGTSVTAQQLSAIELPHQGRQICG